MGMFLHVKQNSRFWMGYQVREKGLLRQALNRFLVNDLIFTREMTENGQFYFESRSNLNR